MTAITRTTTVHDLIRLGLTHGEAKVYLALLELGSSTVGPVSKRSGVAYSNIYSVLDRLIKKGLASTIIKERTSYFQAANPTYLKDYLTKKQDELEEQRKSLDTIIPRIQTLQGFTAPQSAELFIGTKGLRSAYEKFFRSPSKKDEYRFFYIHDKLYGKKADLFYLSIASLFKGINGRGIADQATRKSKSAILFTQHKLLKYRYVLFPVPGNIELYKGQILLIAWEDPVTTILIQSKSIAQRMAVYFEEVWKKAKP